jgi:hypothetical protein
MGDGRTGWLGFLAPAYDAQPRHVRSGEYVEQKRSISNFYVKYSIKTYENSPPANFRALAAAIQLAYRANTFRGGAHWKVPAEFVEGTRSAVKLLDSVRLPKRCPAC